MRASHFLPPILRLPPRDDYRYVLIQTNRNFLERGRSGLGVYKDTGKRDPEVELERLEAGRGTRQKKFDRIHRDFPIRTLPGQCAYLLRAMSGMQAFPDANHRSAFYFIRSLLWNRGVSVRAEPASAAQLVRELKNPRGRCCTAGLRQDQLLEKDDAYRMIQTWFEARLRWSAPHHLLRRAREPLPAWDWSTEMGV